MPEAPSREPFFVLAARYLSRLAELKPERNGLALRPPDAADEHDGYFSQMIGFSPEGGGGDDAVDEEAGAPSPASRPPAPGAAGPVSKA